ncbi:hypothetical protein OHA72_42885 [Dactylosporangium sp. NBC_01737]|uniref:hypothetical protein n=1 Tax=Dactylosporangium sp. NBC_01737 TaxID=2975959 RepID=UPI002E11FE1B|nr:hypothetical protein OHA72_42885 [Dactylosporangium sp. NBC_01737]
MGLVVAAGVGGEFGQLLGLGMHPAVVEATVVGTARARAGHNAVLTGDVSTVLGRAPPHSGAGRGDTGRRSRTRFRTARPGRPDGMATDVLVRSAMLGAAAGARSMTPLAALAAQRSGWLRGVAGVAALGSSAPTSCRGPRAG